MEVNNQKATSQARMVHPSSLQNWSKETMMIQSEVDFWNLTKTWHYNLNTMNLRMFSFYSQKILSVKNLY